MSTFIKLMLLCATVIVIGCASSSFRPIQPVATLLNFPEVNTVTIKELGDTLLVKSDKSTRDAIKVHNSISFSRFGQVITFPAGEYVASNENPEDIVYTGEGVWIVAGRPFGGGFVISKLIQHKQINDVRVWMMDPSQGSNRSGKNITFSKSKVVWEGQPYFQQELIYNGKSGNNIKFLYRELSDNTMRATFNQDIQYDLNESNVIGFKGSRIKVIEATNRQIKYVVLKPFP